MNRFKRIMKFSGNVVNGTIMKPNHKPKCYVTLYYCCLYTIYNLWIQEFF